MSQGKNYPGSGSGSGSGSGYRPYGASKPIGAKGRPSNASKPGAKSNQGSYYYSSAYHTDKSSRDGDKKKDQKQKQPGCLQPCPMGPCQIQCCMGVDWKKMCHMQGQQEQNKQGKKGGSGSDDGSQSQKIQGGCNWQNQGYYYFPNLGLAPMLQMQCTNEKPQAIMPQYCLPPCELCGDDKKDGDDSSCDEDDDDDDDDSSDGEGKKKCTKKNHQDGSSYPDYGQNSGEQRDCNMQHGHHQGHHEQQPPQGGNAGAGLTMATFPQCGNVMNGAMGMYPQTTQAMEAKYTKLPPEWPPKPGKGISISPKDDEGLHFKFKPRPDFATEISFTIEPKKKPTWQKMMTCGFRPMITCAAPPFNLPANFEQFKRKICERSEHGDDKDKQKDDKDDGDDYDDGSGDDYNDDYDDDDYDDTDDYAYRYSYNN